MENQNKLKLILGPFKWVSSANCKWIRAVCYGKSMTCWCLSKCKDAIKRQILPTTLGNSSKCDILNCNYTLYLPNTVSKLGMFHFVYFIQVLRGKKQGYMTVKELQTLSVFGSFFVTSNVLRTFSQPSKFNRIILCGHLSGKLCLTDHCCHIYGPLGKLFSSTSKVWPK